MKNNYRKIIQFFFINSILLLVISCQNLTANQSENINKNKSQITLSSHAWELTSLFNQKVKSSEMSKTPTLSFVKENNKAQGFTGCNNFFGRYTQKDQQLTFSPLGMTRKYCADTAALESKYGDMLSKVTQFKIAAGALQLMMNDNVVATFKVATFKVATFKVATFKVATFKVAK